jgi:hypothetical protein
MDIPEELAQDALGLLCSRESRQGCILLPPLSLPATISGNGRVALTSDTYGHEAYQIAF